jgi:hypothetical protein
MATAHRHPGAVVERGEGGAGKAVETGGTSRRKFSSVGLELDLATVGCTKLCRGKTMASGRTTPRPLTGKACCCCWLSTRHRTLLALAVWSRSLLPNVFRETSASQSLLTACLLRSLVAPDSHQNDSVVPCATLYNRAHVDGLLGDLPSWGWDETL